MGLMEKSEYYRMYRFEKKHWWYKSLRDILGYHLRKLLKRGAKILDAGCGTGQNMVFMNSLGFTVSGVDLSSDAISLSKKRGLKDVQKSDIINLPFKNNSFDLVVSLDVIGSLTEESRKETVREFYRVLKPNGYVLLQAAAYEFIRASHDIVVGTRKRFLKTELENMFSKKRWKVIKSTYRFFFLFPTIALIKLIKRFQIVKTSRSDIIIPRPMINNLLFVIQKIENFFLRYISYPIGSSLFLIVQKK